MKVAITFLVLVALSYSTPQPRKLFHEHFEDFNVVLEEVEQELDVLLANYLEFEEFQASIDYLVTPNFKNLVYEIKDLDDFKAVTDFLENHGINIQYFIDDFNTFVDGIQRRNLGNQLIQVSGRDTTAYVQDNMVIYPKAKLTALYKEKIANDDGFRRTMESFDTEEWNELYSALWQIETFLNEIATLKVNGIDYINLIQSYFRNLLNKKKLKNLL